MKTLVAGWFSFEDGHATAGDLLAAEVACDWLEAAGHRCEIAVARPFRGGVDWRRVVPGDYSDVVFVCGPFGKGRLEEEFLAHFAGRRITGLDLTMLTPLGEWNPFDLLFERDSSATARPDITFLSRHKLVPIVGLCLVEPYAGGLTDVTVTAIRRLLGSREAAVVEIDTRLDANGTGLRSPAEVEALLARMDLVVTTRMHGMVLALKNGVPAIAIDPEAGGAKILRQARVLGWPVVFTVDSISQAELESAFDYCLTDAARDEARRSRERAETILHETREQFIRSLVGPGDLPSSASYRRQGATKAARIGVDSPPMAAPSAEPIATPLAEVSRLRRAARKVLPARFRRLLRGLRRNTEAGVNGLGGPRRLDPVSRKWGYDRGGPIDRYYVEAFLRSHAQDIRGRVLEVGDDAYTREFGDGRVEANDILDVDASNSRATVLADLANADHLPSDRYNCIILTQTLHVIYETRAVIGALHRILKPGGVLLATFPGLSKLSWTELPGSWYWGFTCNSARRLFGEAFAPTGVEVESFGNVLTASAFLYGYSHRELSRTQLEYRDPEFDLLVAVRAVKSPEVN
jgi:SAM-dependent methyltransferase